MPSSFPFETHISRSYRYIRERSKQQKDETYIPLKLWRACAVSDLNKLHSRYIASYIQPSNYLFLFLPFKNLTWLFKPTITRQLTYQHFCPSSLHHLPHIPPSIDSTSCGCFLFSWIFAKAETKTKTTTISNKQKRRKMQSKTLWASTKTGLIS